MNSEYGVSALEARLRDDLVALAFPDVDWVRPVIGPDGVAALNCAVIGAGQAGMTIAAGLKRERVSGVARMTPAWLDLFAPLAKWCQQAITANPSLGLSEL